MCGSLGNAPNESDSKVMIDEIMLLKRARAIYGSVVLEIGHAVEAIDL
jgi:hypothetical protein